MVFFGIEDFLRTVHMTYPADKWDQNMLPPLEESNKEYIIQRVSAQYLCCFVADFPGSCPLIMSGILLVVYHFVRAYYMNTAT